MFEIHKKQKFPLAKFHLELIRQLVYEYTELKKKSKPNANITPSRLMHFCLVFHATTRHETCFVPDREKQLHTHTYNKNMPPKTFEN